MDIDTLKEAMRTHNLSSCVLIESKYNNSGKLIGFAECNDNSGSRKYVVIRGENSDVFPSKTDAMRVFSELLGE